MAHVTLRQPIQEFLRQCQLLVDNLNKQEPLTALEVVLLKAYMKQIRTCLMTQGLETVLPWPEKANAIGFDGSER